MKTWIHRLGIVVAPLVVHHLAGAHRIGGRVGQQAVAQLYWLWLRARGDTTPHVVERMVHRGDVVVDVGGSWGAYLYQFARLVGPSGRVYVCEPHPANQGSLAAIRAGRANVTIFAVALSDHAGEAELHVPNVRGHPITALSSLSAPAGADDVADDVAYETVRVPVERLDALLPADGPAVTFIKCDVEGHELAVLRGAERTLRRSLPTLLIEIEQRHKDADIHATFDYLSGLGYAG
jgi:FkbM family methyltransferase